MGQKEVIENAQLAIQILAESEPIIWVDLNNTLRVNITSVEDALRDLEKTLRVRKSVLEEMMEVVRERNERLNFEEPSPESGKIYNLIASMEEKYNWLDGRLARLEEAQIKTTGWVRGVKKKDQNSLYKAEQKFISDLKQAGILEKLEGGLLDFYINALHDLFLAKEEAIAAAFESDAERLVYLEGAEKEFNQGYKVLKEEYENLWDRLNPSDIALAMPITPYRAEMPEGVERANLTMAGSLGEGGFGDAFLLVNSGEDGPPTMAVKLLKPEEDAEKQKLELRKEVMFYEKIGKHPNIMECYGIQKIEEREGMIMEVLEGGEAAENLTLLNEKYEAGEISDIEYMGFFQHTMRGLMQGLAHMHKAGYAHLDVKFQNLLMDKDGNVKIMDPGLTEEIGLMAEDTPDNPFFKDPTLGEELVAQPYNDVFSAGLAMYHMKRANEFKPLKEQERDKEFFMFGETKVKFMSKFEQKAREWTKDASNRVFEIMPEEAKLALKNSIEEAQEVLADQLKEFEETWASTQKFLAGKATEEEREKLYIEGRTPIFETYDKMIRSIRESFFREYGSPMENAYMNFMNQIMHPDPSQRLSAVDALDHPFLSDSLIQNEESVQEIFWKLKPDLHPDNRVVPQPGDPIPLEDPEVSPLFITVNERQDIKRKVETELEHPGVMRDFLEGEFVQLMNGFQRDMTAWKGRTVGYTSELGITGILDLYRKMPNPRMLSQTVSKTQTEFLTSIATNLKDQKHFAEVGIEYFKSLNRDLEEVEAETRNLLQDVDDMLTFVMKELEKLLLYDQNWRRVFGTTSDGRSRVYAPNEVLKINLEPQVNTLLNNAIQPFLRKGKTNSKSLRKEAATMAYQAIYQEDLAYVTDALAISVNLVKGIKKSPFLNSLFGKKKLKQWPASAAKSVDKLYSHLATCEEVLEEMERIEDKTGDEDTVYTFFAELKEKLIEDLIPRLEAQKEMLDYIDANYETYLSGI